MDESSRHEAIQYILSLQPYRDGAEVAPGFRFSEPGVDEETLQWASDADLSHIRELARVAVESRARLDELGAKLATEEVKLTVVL
jgi:hypothetical protein